jgi:hypothetical protein
MLLFPQSDRPAISPYSRPLARFLAGLRLPETGHISEGEKVGRMAAKIGLGLPGDFASQHTHVHTHTHTRAHAHAHAHSHANAKAHSHATAHAHAHAKQAKHANARCPNGAERGRGSAACPLTLAALSAQDERPGIRQKAASLSLSLSLSPLPVPVSLFARSAACGRACGLRLCRFAPADCVPFGCTCRRFAPHVLCTSCALHLMCFAPHVLCTSCTLHLMCFAPHVLCTCALHLYFAPAGRASVTLQAARPHTAAQPCL